LISHHNRISVSGDVTGERKRISTVAVIAAHIVMASIREWVESKREASKLLRAASSLSDK
jgi:hypothetical protein